tara:strand:- start:58 stop:525 length:468 start_codon:yes stop_codon:yes gene_type:complete
MSNMNITLKIYISSKGDGSTIFEDTFQAGTFEELVENSKNVWVNAKNDGLIESNNDSYVATSKAWPSPENIESIILVNLPNKDEVCILSSSFCVFPDGAMDFFGEPLPYDFPVSGSDVDLDRYGISDLGELDFKPEEYEGREFVEKLFNFYLKFS